MDYILHTIVIAWSIIWVKRKTVVIHLTDKTFDKAPPTLHFSLCNSLLLDTSLVFHLPPQIADFSQSKIPKTLEIFNLLQIHLGKKMKIMVAIKRVVDYAVKVRVKPDKVFFNFQKYIGLMIFEA